MKKQISIVLYIATVLMVLGSTALAGGPRGGYGGGHWQRGCCDDGDEWLWVIPAVIGGAIVYEAARQPPPQTVIIQKSVEPNCSPWTEIQNPDGTVTRTRTCDK